MRNPDRIEPMLNIIKDVWKKNPDLRFGQLVYILFYGFESDMFNVEDDVFFNTIKL